MILIIGWLVLIAVALIVNHVAHRWPTPKKDQ